MKRLLIKVCGMRDVENIRQVEQLAPDWMGFICWGGSSRFVGDTPGYMPDACSRAGVFVNPSLEEIRHCVIRMGLDTIQLHGEETPDFCNEVRHLLSPKSGKSLQLIKAFSIASDGVFPATAPYEDCCDYFLFDTRCATVGGSGKTFDWDFLRQYRGKRPFLLSGGIGEEHAGALKSFSHPMWAGVDLNSRFEDSPAVKNVKKLKKFIHQLREL